MPTRLLLLLGFLFAPVVLAEQSVPHAVVAEAVRAQLQAQSKALPGDLELSVLGRDEPLVLPAGRHEMQVGAVTGPWPRARVAVPVRHLVEGRAVRSQTMWVAVRWWMEADVYADNLVAGTPVAELGHRRERVDLAPHGSPLPVAELPAGQRLRRPVRAGQPMVAADFEPMPDVLAGADVQVEVVRGSVRLSTTGRALAEGFVGDVIPVTVDAGRRPVDSLILTSQAVRVEN